MSSRVLAALQQQKQRVAGALQPTASAPRTATSAAPSASASHSSSASVDAPHTTSPPPNKRKRKQMAREAAAAAAAGAIAQSQSQSVATPATGPSTSHANKKQKFTSNVATPDATPAPSAHSSKKKKKKQQKTAHPIAAAVPAPTPVPGRRLSALQQKMASKLAGARFRWLNEKLYTCTGSEAFEYFQSHPEEFDEYHKGFGVQVKEWPVSPLDQFIEYLKERPTLVAGDFGCGEARLAASVPNRVHSFDLVAHNDRVTACNMSAVPLDDATLDVAIFCLSLMGVDFMSFIREAHRTLKPNGLLLISEVRSRFEESGIDVFIKAVNEVGFTMRRKDLKNQMFATLEFQKTNKQPKGNKPTVAGSAAGANGAASITAGASSSLSSSSSKKKKGAQKGANPRTAKGAGTSENKGTSASAGSSKKGNATGESSSTVAPTLTACIYKKR